MMWAAWCVRMLLIANSSGCARSDSISRPDSYCRSIARSMSAIARSTSRSSPDTGTANVSLGASMRAFAAMASTRAPRSSALMCAPPLSTQTAWRLTRVTCLPLTPRVPSRGSGGRGPAAAGEEFSADRAESERQRGPQGGCGRSALVGLASFACGLLPGWIAPYSCIVPGQPGAVGRLPPICDVELELRRPQERGRLQSVIPADGLWRESQRHRLRALSADQPGALRNHAEPVSSCSRSFRFSSRSTRSS